MKKSTCITMAHKNPTKPPSGATRLNSPSRRQGYGRHGRPQAQRAAALGGKNAIQQRRPNGKKKI